MDDFLGYDIIGDVHGCAGKLEGLLGETLGYDERDGVFRHQRRKAVFVGDLIDGGREQRRTVEIVRSMVEDGAALVVMGNHEFNAISYATPDPGNSGGYMRPHSVKNREQHKEFIDQVADDVILYARTIEWFKTFPLWLEIDGIRIVHACWSDVEIESLREWIVPGTSMSTDFVIEANRKGTPEYQAIEVVLKGPELSLERYGQPAFQDTKGPLRSEARIRWWDPEATTLVELAEIPKGAETKEGLPFPVLPGVPCPDETGYEYRGDEPVFYGHYWRRYPPQFRQDWTPKAACVDFSAVKGGPLVAYQWNGETEISESNYVAFP